MRFLQRAQAWWRNQRMLSLTELDELMDRAVFGRSAAAGVNVNADSVLGIAAVFNAVRILAETVATLPLFVYRRLEGGGKARVTDHPLYRILHDQANSEMTAAEFRECMQAHLTLRNNAFAEIERGKDGRVLGLWPIHPDRARVFRGIDGMVQYKIRLPGEATPVILPARNILHLRKLALNGVTGLDPLARLYNSLGLTIAAERYGAKFFANDASPGGALKVPKKLSDPAYKRLQESQFMQHGGLEQSHRVALLEEGSEWQAIGVEPNKAQFLETRKFQVTETARIFNLPPHFIKDMEHATFTNIEHQGIEFVVYTLRPICVTWEQRLMMSLLSESERGTLFIEHVVDGLLRGDFQTRTAGYHMAKLDGWLNGDEIRELENLNPMPDGLGQIYWQPVNVMEAGSAPPSSNDPVRSDDNGHGLLPKELTHA